MDLLSAPQQTVHSSVILISTIIMSHFRGNNSFLFALTVLYAAFFHKSVDGDALSVTFGRMRAI